MPKTTSASPLNAGSIISQIVNHPLKTLTVLLLFLQPANAANLAITNIDSDVPLSPEQVILHERKFFYEDLNNFEFDYAFPNLDLTVTLDKFGVACITGKEEAAKHLWENKKYKQDKIVPALAAAAYENQLGLLAKIPIHKSLYTQAFAYLSDAFIQQDFKKNPYFIELNNAYQLLLRLGADSNAGEISAFYYAITSINLNYLNYLLKRKTDMYRIFVLNGKKVLPLDIETYLIPDKYAEIIIAFCAHGYNIDTISPLDQLDLATRLSLPTNKKSAVFMQRLAQAPATKELYNRVQANIARMQRQTDKEVGILIGSITLFIITIMSVVKLRIWKVSAIKNKNRLLRLEQDRTKKSQSVRPPPSQEIPTRLKSTFTVPNIPSEDLLPSSSTLIIVKVKSKPKPSDSRRDYKTQQILKKLADKKAERVNAIFHATTQQKEKQLARLKQKAEFKKQKELEKQARQHELNMILDTSQPETPKPSTNQLPARKPSNDEDELRKYSIFFNESAVLSSRDTTKVSSFAKIALDEIININITNAKRNRLSNSNERYGLQILQNHLLQLYQIHRCNLAILLHMKYILKIRKTLDQDIIEDCRAMLMHGGALHIPIDELSIAAHQLATTYPRILISLEKFKGQTLTANDKEFLHGIMAKDKNHYSLTATPLYKFSSKYFNALTHANLSGESNTTDQHEDGIFIHWVTSVIFRYVNTLEDHFANESTKTASATNLSTVYTDHINRLKMLFTFCGEYFNAERKARLELTTDTKLINILKQCHLIRMHVAHHIPDVSILAIRNLSLLIQRYTKEKYSLHQLSFMADNNSFDFSPRNVSLPSTSLAVPSLAR